MMSRLAATENLVSKVRLRRTVIDDGDDYDDCDDDE